MKKILKYRGITLIPVENGTYLPFNSALEKSSFLKHHNEFEYEKHDENSVILYKYIAIDTSFSGFCLTPTKALTYVECMTLIDMYL